VRQREVIISELPVSIDDDPDFVEDPLVTEAAAEPVALGPRAARTREAILEATRNLFLVRGYAGTRINNITDACGISRAGFYTYFRDKREIFNVLGEAAYHGTLDIVGQWTSLPNPCESADVERWVASYFSFMDTHGAFIFSASQSSPSDPAFRASSERMQMRVRWLLGVNLRNRQVRPTQAPEALGLAVLGMLDQSWYHCRVQRLSVDDGDIIRTIAEMIFSSLTANSLEISPRA
jgi:AcrR family transcriptional regulator